MKIKIVDISKVTPYFNNPRENTNAVEPVVESIKRYGFIKPIIVDKKGVIIAGHTRYMAAVRLNLAKIPCIYSDMSDERAKQYRIADNKLAEKSVYDENALIEELKNLEVPKDMQAFFFEDVEAMMNFSFESIQCPDSENYDPEEDGESSESDGQEENGNDESSEENTGIDLNDLYKIEVIDGKKTMRVYCPYCGNIERVTLN